MPANNVITIIDIGIKVGDLEDVNDSGKTQGGTLVYNQSTDTYVVKKLDLTMFSGNVDGGTF